jgi:hypothetical protein
MGENGRGDFAIIDGIRVAAMLWLILGHTFDSMRGILKVHIRTHAYT